MSATMTNNNVGSALASKDPKAARDIITMHAYTSGLRAGGIAGSIAGTGVLLAHKYWPAFRTRLGISGKWGLVVMSSLGVFTIVSDKRLLAGARNPQMYLASLDPAYVDDKIQDKKRLHWHHRLANFVYDHPYRSLVTVGVPLVGAIYAMQRTNKAIAASQQIMHTRIYGQGAVVVLLLASMGFNDYMRKHGRFEEMPDDKEQGVTQEAL